MSERVPERIWIMPQSVTDGVPTWEDGGEWFSEEPPAEWGPRALCVTRARADAEKAEAVRMTLVSAAAWCAQQRMEWVRDAKRNPDSAKAAYGKASSYSAAETHFRALADEVKP